MATKASIRQMRYDKAHQKQYNIKMNLVYDKDIIEKLSSVPSIMGYIKQLIREDIARTCSSVPKEEREEKKMKTYRIKPDYMDLWGSWANNETVLTESEIAEQAKAWEKPIEELMEQVYPNTPSEVKWYLGEEYDAN